MQTDVVVSSDSEDLILVNAQDESVGQLSKLECHLGDGILHRAFSIFILNENGQLLLQQRSAEKFLWPLYWSNTCCSHPRAGETMDEAVHRRLEQELGFSTELEYLYKFVYKTPFEDKGTEHELCHVWIGRHSGEVKVNKNEISDWRYLDPKELDKELKTTPEHFTPWMKMEWETIKREYSRYLT